MATYVNNLRLKEITTGDESGTWGTSTNTNLELIADAFGSGTEGITTNADTHTTTIADGAADEGRAIFLKYTGTLDQRVPLLSHQIQLISSGSLRTLQAVPRTSLSVRVLVPTLQSVMARSRQSLQMVLVLVRLFWMRSLIWS